MPDYPDPYEDNEDDYCCDEDAYCDYCGGCLYCECECDGTEDGE